MLVYRPGGAPTVLTNQLGWYTADGSVATSSHPGANAVNLLVEEVILNYLALHGQQGLMQSLFPGNGLGGAAQMDALTAFAPL
jgi:hypothetical protein